jgi:hypothetical protein
MMFLFGFFTFPKFNGFSQRSHLHVFTPFFTQAHTHTHPYAHTIIYAGDDGDEESLPHHYDEADTDDDDDKDDEIEGDG